LNYLGKTNSDIFQGFAVGCLLCAGCGIENVYENGEVFVKLDWTLKIKSDWRVFILDKGPNCLEDGEKVRARDEHGTIVDSVLLDGYGYKLEPEASPVWKYYTVRGSVAFSGMV
jgi:hypothetical protein